MTIKDLNPKFIENMKKILGDEFSNYECAIKNEPVRGVRVNPLKMSNMDFEKVFKYDVEKIPYEKQGYILNTLDKIGKSLIHMAGCIYLQEPSSMVPVASLEVSADAKVLDLCAAPGGKSTQVAIKIPDGILVSNEIVTQRSKVLFSNIERLGVANSVILNDTPVNISEKLPAFFDAVLVDAPCGGEGMFRKDPDTIKEWSQERLETNHQRQIEILKCADKCLKKGGKLVYSTCTFSEIENEDVIIEFLSNYNYKVCEINEEIKNVTRQGTKVPQARRFYPFSSKGEGQFVCVLEKIDESYDELTKNKKSNFDVLTNKEKSQVREFLSYNFDLPFEYNLIKAHDNIMIVTNDMMSVIDSGVNIINAGVRVGMIEKGIIKPHHQLFSALGKYSKYKYELDDAGAQKYVHGEELFIENGANAYYTVCFSGASLGGGKCVGGRLKNLYPKGLRI